MLLRHWHPAVHITLSVSLPFSAYSTGTEARQAAQATQANGSPEQRTSVLYRDRDPAFFLATEHWPSVKPIRAKTRYLPTVISATFRRKLNLGHITDR